MTRLIILGAGGYANVVREVAEQEGYEVVDMLDDKIEGHELNTYKRYLSSNVQYIPAFGNNELRMQWINQLKNEGAHLATVVHSSAYVSPKATIQTGCVVLPRAIINTGVMIESGSIINLGAIIDHGCIIEEGCHVCIGAVVKADNRIATLTKIEAGEVIEARKYLV